MKRIAICSVLVFLSLTAESQNKVTSDYDAYLKERGNALDDYRKKSEDGQQKIAEDWESYRVAAEEDYQKYLAAENARYEEFRRRVIASWGEDNYAEDGPKRIVEYSEDFQSRSDVDLENGVVEVEILAELGAAVKDAASSIRSAVKDFVDLKLDDGSQPAFLEQLDLAGLGLTIKSGAEKIADKIIDTIVPEKEIIDTEEGQKQVFRVRIELAEDHLSTRAAEFKDIIRANSRRFSVDEPLIYAVIEQESAFNPRAKSSAPAYGLMQLVPKSGGREAYRHVHGRDLIPLPVYLYVPKNNIELGTGYLHKLMTVTFADVTDPDSRMLCAIAAYNTGPGNVSKALTCGTSVAKAVPVINSMSYDKLYERLRRKLPYSETRNYIQGVTAKREKYIRR